MPRVGPAVKLAETTLKQLKKVMGVQNISVSEGVVVREADSQEARAQGLAKILLLHLGAGNEPELEETSQRWGEVILTRARSMNDDARMDWSTLSEWSQKTVVVVAATKETRVPADGVVDKSAMVQF